MSDLWTMGAPADGEAARDDGEGGGAPRRRAITRPRSLPGSRAVVGALLVTAAAVGVFASYLNATSEPDTSYVVALGEVPIGTVLTEDVLRDPTMFGLAPIDLPLETAAGALTGEQALGLAGQVTAAPLASGDLVVRSGLVDGGETDGTARLSFPIDAARAVGGVLEPGDRVDIVATFGSGAELDTRYVVRDVLLANVIASDGGLGSTAGSLVLTVALEDDAVLEVAQAIDGAEVFVVRSPIGATGPDADDAEEGEAEAGDVAPPVEAPEEVTPEEEPPTPDEQDAAEDDEGPAEDDGDED